MLLLVLCSCIYLLLLCTACVPISIAPSRPTDRLEYSIVSPDGMHVLQLYQNDGRGATITTSSTVAVSAVNGGRKWLDQETWFLFFSYRYTFIDVEWIDEQTIRITSSPEHPSKQFVLTMNIYQDEFQ